MLAKEKFEFLKVGFVKESKVLSRRIIPRVLGFFEGFSCGMRPVD
jgi:hypothetical protein